MVEITFGELLLGDYFIYKNIRYRKFSPNSGVDVSGEGRIHLFIDEDKALIEWGKAGINMEHLNKDIQDIEKMLKKTSEALKNFGEKINGK